MAGFSPIVIFAYHRPVELARVLRRLRRCWGIGGRDLYVFCDGAGSDDPHLVRNVAAVRRLVRAFRWPGNKRVFERECNLGLATSVIEGVSLVLDEHQSVIVLEDDIVVSPAFLKFLDTGLEAYRDDDRVAGVSGYGYGNLRGVDGNYFLRAGCSWSWATWRRVWDRVEWNTETLIDGFEASGGAASFRCGAVDYFRMLERHRSGLNDSWAIRYLASAWLKEQLFLYPKHSLAINIGFGAGATHTHEVLPLHATKYSWMWSGKMPPVAVVPANAAAIQKLFSLA